MKARNLQIILLLVIFTFFNCSNNEQDQLPPISQTGANTFGCIINDKVLIPKDGIGVPQPKGITVKYRTNKNFIIDAANLKDTNGDRIYLYVNNLTSTGTYSFGLSNGDDDFTFEPAYPHCWARTFDSVSGGFIYISNINSGTITITRFDEDNHIASGTFKLNVFNENNPNKTTEITQGRFDVNWIEL